MRAVPCNPAIAYAPAGERRRAAAEGSPHGRTSVAGARYLAMDLGGTKISVSLWDDGPGGPRKAGGARWATLPGGPEDNIDRMVSEARALLGGADGGSRRLDGIGISGGGPLDPERGVILSVPNLPGWTDVPIAGILEDRLGAPARIENDANACAVAEWLRGAGRGSRNLVFLTCSTGIGAGLILDGKLYRGSRFLAGEAGHQVIVPGGLPCGCGNRGCLEAYASGAGIARRLEALRAAQPGLPRTAREVVERARGGDAFSVRFLRETGEYLGMGLANIVFLLNPERIVLGTIAVGAGALLLDPAREFLSRAVWPPLLEGLEILPAALGEDLGDHAALSVARDLDRLLPQSGG
jgi:glucokinase